MPGLLYYGRRYRLFAVRQCAVGDQYWSIHRGCRRFAETNDIVYRPSGHEPPPSRDKKRIMTDKPRREPGADRACRRSGPVRA